MTKTCPDCQATVLSTDDMDYISPPGRNPKTYKATVLSTSQPERVGIVPDGATHIRRPEYVTAWLFDGVATMPLWLIERYHSLPLPAHRKGCYALAVDGEFWRWIDVARFEEMFMPAALAATPAVDATQGAFECMGRKQSLPEPGECNWPDCGCDPHATKVIESLLEQGWTGPAVTSTDGKAQ